jgi:3-isopropylmalate dehydrogenase
VTAYSIVCLSGDGIGPEVMAQASRGLTAAAHLHGFGVDEEHVPFGADATMRFGHPFPPAARRSALAADAVLAATVDRGLLRALEAELDVRAGLMRVRRNGSALTVVAPLAPDASAWTLERAVATAHASRGRIAFVGSDDDWTDEAAAEAKHEHGLEVSRSSTRRAIQQLVSDPAVFDVVVCEHALLAPLAELAWCLDPRRVLAWGRLAADGPGIFGPSHGTATDIAGQGVADPSSMLLAAALMLGEGLGERGAAATLSAAVSSVRNDGSGPRGRVTMTAELTDAVLARLPQSHSNAEFLTEAV